MTWTAGGVEPVKPLLAQRVFGGSQLVAIDQDVDLRAGGVGVDVFRAFTEGVANVPPVQRVEGGGERAPTRTLPHKRGRESSAPLPRKRGRESARPPRGRRLRPTGRCGWLKAQHRPGPRRISAAPPGCPAESGRPAGCPGLPWC